MDIVGVDEDDSDYVATRFSSHKANDEVSALCMLIDQNDVARRIEILLCFHSYCRSLLL